MNDVMDARATQLEALKQGPTEAAMRKLLGESPISVSLERTHFSGTKPARLHYAVHLASGNTVPVLAEHVPKDTVSHVAKVRASLRKSRNGQRAGLHGGAVVACEISGLALRRVGLDERLPGLRLLYDAEFARSTVARLLGRDPGPVVVELVAHRLGKRAVLKIAGPYAQVFARLRAIKSSDGSTRYSRHLSLWKVLGERCGLRIPDPLGEVREYGLSLFASLPGEPPDFSCPGVARQIVLGLEGLRKTQLECVPMHKGTDEAQLLQDWLTHCRVWRPDLAQRLSPHIEQVSQRLAALPSRACPCHRDLHEKQILMAHGTAGILDFDTLSLADPALDPGNLLAHLFLAGQPEGPLRQVIDLPDVDLWRKAALLRLVMIYAFTSMPGETFTRLITEARQDDRD